MIGLFQNHDDSVGLLLEVGIVICRMLIIAPVLVLVSTSNFFFFLVMAHNAERDQSTVPGHRPWK